MVRNPPENMAGKWATGRWLGMEEKRPYVPGLSSQGWQVMLPTASLSVRFRDGLLTCDASNAEAAAPMQEYGIVGSSGRSQQETNREFK